MSSANRRMKSRALSLEAAQLLNSAFKQTGAIPIFPPTAEGNSKSNPVGPLTIQGLNLNRAVSQARHALTRKVSIPQNAPANTIMSLDRNFESQIRSRNRSSSDPEPHEPSRFTFERNERSIPEGLARTKDVMRRRMITRLRSSSFEGLNNNLNFCLTLMSFCIYQIPAEVLCHFHLRAMVDLPQ